MQRFSTLPISLPASPKRGMMIGRNDLPHIFQMSRSLKAAAHVGLMVTRYARDRLTHARGTRLVNGNALIARMAAAAIG
jgi:hypothetical protein